ncbi:uncharacterized protein YcaQ [Catalinimonas alkaloidigena]|uniref:winged helix-turn-helix domain-containing protein n=1 Tax=Catalinimonas alkaloidigena TaxID=1075417 RepID=UPI002405C55B|nr:crosslink repair DNA glycosylase YcaQ family protein [Catalinimonas alkaloidigena]MDF9795442.1 uncharacterized protein YcaQ [Catalinimonas alkaloidigena]
MLNQLQRATLQCQGLTTRYPFGKGKQAVLSALERLGYIQIDTLSVVERAHHHTLWTRIPGYQTEYLAQLVEERKAFEYWFHAASYLPMKDYRYALPQMLQVRRGEAPYYRNADPKVLDDVMDKIRIDGPQKARDFTSFSKKPGSWWNWKPTKIALEQLFMQGDLMVCGREGMEKIYDLTERVLPKTTNTTEPSAWEFAEYLVNTYLRAYGVTTVKQITHLRKGNALRKNTELVLQSMLEEKTVQEIHLDGMPTMYALSELLENSIKKPSSGIRLLSPFDNALIHRERLALLFNYDFRLECYVPKAKRQYGYFCLPILFGDEFIGRIDCKAHRKDNQFELIHLHIEKKQDAIALWLKPLMKAVQQFAIFNGCPSIKISQVSPAKLSEMVKRSFEE